MTTREHVLGAVADRVPHGDGIRVGVDGVDGAGKTTFADDLAGVLRARDRDVVRVRADDFLHLRGVRHRRGRHDPEGFFLDSYDLERLRRDVLEPLGPGGSRRYRPASYDLATDRVLDPPEQVAAPHAVLVLDGLFLHRDELAGTWDVSVFLDVAPRVSVPRMAARDGTDPDPAHPSNARYVQGQRLYAERCRPRERASLVVDATDLDAPVLLD